MKLDQAIQNRSINSFSKYNPMATIQTYKNNFTHPNIRHSHPHLQPKALHKISLSSNIFASHYHIQEVHIISNGTVLYETIKDNQKHIIHQVQIYPQTQNCHQSLIQLIMFTQKPYVDYIYFQTHQIQHFSGLNQQEKTEQIIKILENQDKIKCYIVLSSSVGLEYNMNQKYNPQDFLQALNQFLSFINSYSQITQNLDNSLLLKSSSSPTVFIHPLDILIPDSLTKYNSITLQTIIKHYLVISLAKSLKDLLNIRSKSIQTILNLYATKHPQTQFDQFKSLLREAIQNQQKFTPKMLICYIQILKQKHLKSKEEKEIFKHISNSYSVHQPPQKDFSPQKRSKQSNSFIHSHQQKQKSLSRKIELNKENDVTEHDHYRRSDGPKSSSMISMSPNKKNRKYMKCATTSLFSNKNQSFERTSSTSFLFKTTNGFNRNSSSSSFLDKNHKKTCVPNTQSNFLKNFYDKNQIKPEKNVKGYLQMMGFKSKENDSFYKQSASIVEISKKCTDDQRNIQKNPNEACHITESKLISQSSFSRPQIEENQENRDKNKNKGNPFIQNPINQIYLIENGSMISDADEKKLRLKQSLNLLSKKSLNADNFTPSHSIKGKEKQYQGFKKRKDERHNSIIPESEKVQSIQKIPLQEPITATVIHKGRLTDEIVIEKSSKFKMCKLNEMDIKIKGSSKSQQLKIERSTVMAMHFVNLDCSRKQHSPNKYSYHQRTSRENDQLLKSQEEHQERKNQRQVSFKPSLASVKKQKKLEKNQTIDKLAINDTQSNRSVIEKEKEKSIQEQIPTNKSFNVKSQVSKNRIETQKMISQTDNLQTSYLTKLNTSEFQANQSQKPSTVQQNQFQLSKQFFKQIFLFINSENKTLVDLLGSKLSYEITFYAFYINYFKLNVTKSASKQSIDRMRTQINDYEAKIKDSQKITSKEKMLPEFEPLIKKLLSLGMESFVDKFWKRDELKQKDRENNQKISDDIGKLTAGILKITMKIIQANIFQLKCNQKQLHILVKGLKICATIAQLVYSIENKLITLSSVELKKLNQIALENQSGYEKQWMQTIAGFQDLIVMYNGWGKQAETDYNIKINTKNENKKIWTLLEND